MRLNDHELTHLKTRVIIDKAKSIKAPGLLDHFKLIVLFFKKMQIIPGYFFLAIACSSFSVFFNMVGIALLFPLCRGLIEGDFTKVGDRLGVSKFLTAKFPGVFESNTSYFILLLGMIVLATVIKNAMTYFSSLSIGQQMRRANGRMRHMVVERVFGFGKQYFDGFRVVEVNQTVIAGAEAITGQLQPIVKLLTQALSLLVYLAIMFWLSWQLTLVALVLFPLRHYITDILSSKIREASIRFENSRLDLMQRLHNAVSCIALVKSYAAEDMERDEVTRLNETELRDAFEAQKLQLLLSPIQDISTIAFLLIMAFVMAAMAPNYGPAQVTKYLMLFYLIKRAMPNFALFATLNLSIARSAGRLERITAMLSDEGKYFVQAGDRNFEGLQKSIEFRNLQFGYDKGRPVLHNVNLVVEKGKMTAIVGKTGAGKTTIAHLLARFYDCPPGSIFMDGVDIRDFSLRSLAEHIAIVTQEPMIIQGTLRENVTYGLRHEISDAELNLALEYAQLSEFAKRLPQGVDTLVGEKGAKFSGGEKQRIAIARVFLKKADLVILDEATSALDTKTERKIQQDIDKLTEHETCVVIAHRLSTVASADKIIVLEDGCVVEEGTWTKLLAKKGAFYEYWDAQKVLDGQRNTAVETQEEEGVLKA
ncbi:MAG: ABC transporter ATP-binding protein [Candidatus Omnitrophota bacterium]|nr:ABC transporter ATP-binding protein [Candidatus Omnitrophota bacterium]